MSKELKHIGPIVERKIYDSWSINGYLVTLSAGLLGGGCVMIYRGEEKIKWMPTDCTHNVVLLYINNFIWACENDCIHFLPEPFKPAKMKRLVKSTDEPIEASRLYHTYPNWEDYKAQFKIQDTPYVDVIDENLIEQNADKIAKVTLEELKKELHNDAELQKIYKKKKSG